MNQTSPSGSTPVKAFYLVAAMCTAQVLGMLGVFAFPALLPDFMNLWGLTNSQAGWISGIYFAGYSIAVPVLTSLTDRIDSRKIYLFSCFVSMIASILFGELALKFGRRRTVSFVMAVSGLLGLGLGFLADVPYPALVCLCIVYTIFFQGDSAAIHAGVITAADPERRGAAMAFQSLAGFASAAISPIAVGFVLDISGGGNSTGSWGLTFGA